MISNEEETYRWINILECCHHALSTCPAQLAEEPTTVQREAPTLRSWVRGYGIF